MSCGPLYMMLIVGFKCKCC